MKYCRLDFFETPDVWGERQTIQRIIIQLPLYTSSLHSPLRTLTPFETRVGRWASTVHRRAAARACVAATSVPEQGTTQ
eukprot:7553466-Pyramimonas_sp.AAC.1